MQLNLDSQFNRPLLYVENLSDRPGHFEKLFRACNEIAQLPEACLDITIDFNYCEFMGHSGVAFLGGLVHLIKARGGHVNFNWDSLRPNIRMNLAQNGFLGQFGCKAGPWQGNSIPFRSDLWHNATDIGDYLRYKWLGRGWVCISPRLQEAITGTVSELYLNAFEHGHSEIGVFSCGQHYPKMGMLHLTVIDFGIGIPTSVRALPENDPLTTAEALSWALQSGTTTKKQNGISRGLGLNLLQDFVTKNHGNLTIFSNDAWVTIDDNGVIYENRAINFENRAINFSGTLVNIALKCDEQYYCLVQRHSLFLGSSMLERSPRPPRF